MIAVLVSFIGALLGISGGLFLVWKERFAKRMSLYLVAFSVGTLFASAFFDMIPEALESGSSHIIMTFVFIGIFVFFVLEKLLVLHHCHKTDCDIKEQQANGSTFIHTLLVGDTLHNFVDGIAIAVAFSVDIHLGITTAIAVFAHEFPKEIGDMAVFLHGGLTKMRAISYNVISALAAPIGTVAGLFLGSFIEPYAPMFLGFIAGSFIYVAASDLVPHLHEEANIKKSVGHVSLMLLGVALIVFVISIGGH